MSAMRTIRAFA